MSSSVIVTIVVVLGIIVAGGFLLYFMGDLLMSLSNKNKDADAIKNKQSQDAKALEARVSALENKENSPVATILYNGAVVENYNPDEEEKEESNNETEEVSKDEATETEETPVAVEEVEEQPTSEETPAEETTEETEESEEDDEDEEDEEDTAELIRKGRAELMARLAELQEEAGVEDEEAVEETPVAEDVVEEQTKTSEETSVEENETAEENEESEVETEETNEEETTETEETPVAVEEVEEQPETIEEAHVEEEVEEPANETNIDTEIKVEQASTTEEPAVALANTLSVEELEAQLADAQERLKTNEKDLRQCKKEFLPLRRVKKTLENDEKKLRRKEALVAKQKVVLYGVNNYSDIDEEKAKKLAEDLDLLDGLKLSVQHCEEVMSKNEERYPLLEKIYTLLTSQNEQLKEDVDNLQKALDSLKTPADTDSDTTTDTTDAE